MTFPRVVCWIRVVSWPAGWAGLAGLADGLAGWLLMSGCLGVWPVQAQYVPPTCLPRYTLKDRYQGTRPEWCVAGSGSGPGAGECGCGGPCPLHSDTRHQPPVRSTIYLPLLWPVASPPKPSNRQSLFPLFHPTASSTLIRPAHYFSPPPSPSTNFLPPAFRL